MDESMVYKKKPFQADETQQEIRVLIVDDEESVRRIINRLLIMNGYECMVKY